jgi:hypothetical protein
MSCRDSPGLNLGLISGAHPVRDPHNPLTVHGVPSLLPGSASLCPGGVPMLCGAGWKCLLPAD